VQQKNKTMRKINLLTIGLIVYLIGIAAFSWKKNPNQDWHYSATIFGLCFVIVFFLRFVLIRRKRMQDKNKDK
jgi:predicted membrane channel-forming protein YqfA (hemolysin III family)